MEPFEAWLRRRVAQAVEAGEVPAVLLAELQAAFDAARDKPHEEGHHEAVRAIVEILAMPVDQVEDGLRALETQPAAIRELLMRRITQAWLEGQRKD